MLLKKTVGLLKVCSKETNSYASSIVISGLLIVPLVLKKYHCSKEAAILVCELPAGGIVFVLLGSPDGY